VRHHRSHKANDTNDLVNEPIFVSATPAIDRHQRPSTFFDHSLGSPETHHSRCDPDAGRADIPKPSDGVHCSSTIQKDVFFSIHYGEDSPCFARISAIYRRHLDIAHYMKVA